MTMPNCRRLTGFQLGLTIYKFPDQFFQVDLFGFCEDLFDSFLKVARCRFLIDSSCLCFTVGTNEGKRIHLELLNSSIMPIGDLCGQLAVYKERCSLCSLSLLNPKFCFFLLCQDLTSQAVTSFKHKVSLLHVVRT